MSISLESLKKAPKWFLLFCAAVGFLLSINWARGVDEIVKESPKVMERLGIVENRVGSIEEIIGDLRDEVRQQHIETLEHYRWVAERESDWSRAKKLDDKLRNLKK